MVFVVRSALVVHRQRAVRVDRAEDLGKRFQRPVGSCLLVLEVVWVDGFGFCQNFRDILIQSRQSEAFRGVQRRLRLRQSFALRDDDEVVAELRRCREVFLPCDVHRTDDRVAGSQLAREADFLLQRDDFDMLDPVLLEGIEKSFAFVEQDLMGHIACEGEFRALEFQDPDVAIFADEGFSVRCHLRKGQERPQFVLGGRRKHLVQHARYRGAS